jgi:hypothetical protein
MYSERFNNKEYDYNYSDPRNAKIRNQVSLKLTNQSRVHTMTLRLRFTGGKCSRPYATANHSVIVYTQYSLNTRNVVNF